MSWSWKLKVSKETVHIDVLQGEGIQLWRRLLDVDGAYPVHPCVVIEVVAGC